MAKSSSDSNSLGDDACSMNYLITISSPRKPAPKRKRPYPIYGRRPITRTPSESCKEILKKKPLNTLLSSTLMPASISITDHLDDSEDSSGSSSSSCSITSSSSSSCSCSSTSFTASSSSVGPNHHTVASKEQATAVYVLCKVVNGKFVRV